MHNVRFPLFSLPPASYPTQSNPITPKTINSQHLEQCRWRTRIHRRNNLHRGLDLRLLEPVLPAMYPRISSIPCIIPSLHTFLEDTKYLEPCCKILREILPPRSKGTISQRFRRIHDRPLDASVEIALWGMQLV